MGKYKKLKKLTEKERKLLKSPPEKKVIKKLKKIDKKLTKGFDM